MYSKRVIPCLLMENGTLIKGKKFENHKIIGDPVNTVKIFSEHEVDELLIVDRSRGRNIDFKLLEKIAKEARMPIVYGGGILDEKTAIQVVAMGFERVLLNGLLYTNPSHIQRITREIGSQAVIVSINVTEKKNLRNSVSKCSTKDLVKYLDIAANTTCSEILVNDIDSENMWTGPNEEILSMICENIDFPIIYQGGIGSEEDIYNLLDVSCITAVGVGSFFVYLKQNNGVLIHIPAKLRKNHGQISEISG